MERTLAQITNPVIPSGIGSGGNAVGRTALGGFISALMGAILIFAFILAFVNLIIGGIAWITASGDKGKLETARNKITNAIIGLLIVASAWAVMTLIGNFLGLGFPTLNFPTIGSIIGS